MGVTIPGAVLIQFYLLRMSKVLLETCRDCNKCIKKIWTSICSLANVDTMLSAKRQFDTPDVNVLGSIAS
jgi:hypothetical protein